MISALPRYEGSAEHELTPASESRVSVIDPLRDERWKSFVAEHPNASAFHTPEWLRALADTYGYEPLAVTTAKPSQPLSDGLALCRVKSWITGKRLVSVPFADHCEPLMSNEAFETEIGSWLQQECDRGDWRYVELRPRSLMQTGDSWSSGQSYWFHTLDMSPSLEQIFNSLDKDSVQRRIRHAEKQGLEYETGNSAQLLKGFYPLMCRTRRRHGIFPQPIVWFRNLLRCMGDNLQIRIVRKAGEPVASILTLRHRQRVIYKYGCSDERFHHLAGTPLLFWRLIEESTAANVSEIDFGRSDLDHAGLVAFKERLGGRRQHLCYLRYSSPSDRRRSHATGANSWLGEKGRKRIVRFMPDAVLKGMGRVLYRHLG